MVNFLIGLTSGIGISCLAFRTRTLSRSGALASSILGTIVFGLGGVGWAVVLLIFFISASILSKLFKTRKADLAKDFAKGARRDAGQVLANGGVAGVLVLAFVIMAQRVPESCCLSVLWLAFAASIAGANADTWATELGVFNPRQPVLITTFKRMPQGTSGAVSLVGSLAALAGAALVAGMAVLSAWAGWGPVIGLSLWMQFLIILAGGVVGAFVDSYLGATFQAVYYCPSCDKETERHPLHSCGNETIRWRGLSWLNNDWVNAACTLSAALVGVVLAVIVL